MPRKKKVHPKATEKLIEQLGKRIKALRIQHGHSNYEKFAFENDIGRAQYHKYEKGLDMQFSSIIRIANIYGLTLEEFFSEGFD